MASSQTAFDFHCFWNKHQDEPYFPGEVVVKFESKDGTENARHVEIQTPHLNLSSLQKGDQAFYAELRAKPNVNRLFGDGSIINQELANRISDGHISRWDEGIALSGLNIFLKEAGSKDNTNTVTRTHKDEYRIGFAILGYGDQYIKNTAQPAIILDDTAWGESYGKEVLWSLSNTYANELKKRNLFYGPKKEPYVGIEYSVRPDNPKSMDAILNSGADIQHLREMDKLPIMSVFA